LLALWLPVQGLAADPTVIVLSWDGVRHDYPERAETPSLDRVARTGARASRLVPVFPSSTFPNHVALATGTYSDRHGIVGNVFYEPERGLYSYSSDASWIEAEPLWVAAERQGVRAATFFWVGSETDWNGLGASYRVAPFDSDVSESEKVQQILTWLDLPETERPRLIMSWWHGADSAGHDYGPDDGKVVEQLEAQDVQLGRLLDGVDGRGLWETTTLFIVSDHGMTTVSRGIDVEDLLDDAGIASRVVRGGAVGYVSLEDSGTRARALEVLNAQAGLEAHASDALPAELRAMHPRRTGDITVICEPPQIVGTGPGGWLKGLMRRKSGAHGYRPDHPDMGTIFYATGRGVPAGLELGAMRSIDLAATVAALLGIDPPFQSEGDPIPGLQYSVPASRGR
jgi:predicted AlkP superfamily pyrophosphatase or phosphodiesterase